MLGDAGANALGRRPRHGHGARRRSRRPHGGRRACSSPSPCSPRSCRSAAIIAAVPPLRALRPARAARRSAVRASLVAVLVAVVGAVAAGRPAGEPEAPRRRLLVVSLPGVTWAEVQRRPTCPPSRRSSRTPPSPTSRPAPRAPRAGPGDAYLTISAGARADHRAHRRRPGARPRRAEQRLGRRRDLRAPHRRPIPDGEFVALSWPELVRANDRERLRRRARACSATRSPRPASSPPRSATPTAPTRSASPTSGRSGWRSPTATGCSTAGRSTDEVLLRHDPAAPVRRAPRPRRRRRRRSTRPGTGPSDADDRARARGGLRPGPGHALPAASSTPPATRSCWAEALADADDLLGELLERGRPRARQRHGRRALQPARRPRPDAWSPSARRDRRRATSRSASTQRAGFATLVDIAPDDARRPRHRPPDRDGGPARRGRRAAATRLDERVDHLVVAQRRLPVPGAAAGARPPRSLVVAHDAARRRDRVRARVAAGPRSCARGWRRARSSPWRRCRPPTSPAACRSRSSAPACTGRSSSGVAVVAAAVATVARAPARAARPPAEAGARPRHRRARRRRDDRIQPEPQRRLRLLADRQLPPLRHQQLRLRAALRRRLPARRVPRRLEAHPQGPVGRASACWWACSSCWASRSGAPTSAACWPSPRRIALFVAAGDRPPHPPAARRGRRAGRRRAPSPRSGSSTCPGRPRSGPTSGGCSSGSATRGSSRCCRSWSASWSPTSTSRPRALWVAAIPVAIVFWVFLRPAPEPPDRRPRAGGSRALPPAWRAATVAAVLGSLVNDSGAIVGGVAAMVLTASLVHLVVSPGPEPT